MNDSTYNGQSPDRGELIPMALHGGEGYARLECGGTSVILSYTLLHALVQNIHPDSQSIHYLDLKKAVRAIESITCEASIGNTPTK